MSNPIPTDNDPSSNEMGSWESCQSGELQSLGQSLRKTERVRIVGQVVQRSMIAAAAVILLAFSITTLTANSQPGGITCAECHDHFAAYEQHLSGTASMTDSEAGSMDLHLANCPKCYGIFDKAYPGLLATAGASAIGAFSLLGLVVLKN